MPNISVPANGEAMPEAIRKPEYRALMMFDTLSDGCISFMCMDEYSLPHIRPGEFVVVDTNDRTPRDGEVYVIQWDGGRRNICQAQISRGAIAKGADERLWVVHSLKNIAGRAAINEWIEQATAITARTGVVQQLPGWADGWFNDDHLESKLVGCVIGIYAPAFEEPKRIVGRTA